MNRSEAVEELKRVYKLLDEDLKLAREATLSNPTEFNKRTLVRTCIANVEGLAYHLRQVTLSTLQGTHHLSEGDLAILNESKYQLTDQGVVQRRKNFQDTRAMLLFSLRVYAKNHGASFSPNVKDNGWRCLQEAIKIRDRLMHPKSFQSLSVTDEEGKVFSAGVKWWDDAIVSLLKACQAADQELTTNGPNA